MLALLTVGALVSWLLMRCPPPELLLRHGWPGGGATGRSLTTSEGIIFAEVASGYVRAVSVAFPRSETPLDSILQKLGFSVLPGDREYWIEIPETFWISESLLKPPREGESGVESRGAWTTFADRLFQEMSTVHPGRFRLASKVEVSLFHNQTVMNRPRVPWLLDPLLLGYNEGWEFQWTFGKVMSGFRMVWIPIQPAHHPE